MVGLLNPKEVSMQDNLEAKRCSDLFKALADPHRLMIIQSLRSGPQNVTEIASALKVPIVNVSHHLGVLKAFGLVQDKKAGRFVRYSLNNQIFVSVDGDTTTLDLGVCKLVIPLKS
jgi:DNA-binding transcriptional ArsR family regulator